MLMRWWNCIVGRGGSMVFNAKHQVSKFVLHYGPSSFAQCKNCLVQTMIILFLQQNRKGVQEQVHCIQLSTSMCMVLETFSRVTLSSWAVLKVVQKPCLLACSMHTPCLFSQTTIRSGTIIS